MNTKLKYLPVNWKNGMAFSQNHLSSQYLAIADSIRDASALQMHPANYGILGGDVDNKFGEPLVENITNEFVDITYCRAISQNGSRIELLSDQIDELRKPLSELVGSRELNKSHFWYILLVVDIFTRIPAGLEDEQEIPRRKPFNRPNYSLELISEEELRLDNLANALPVAKFQNTPSGLKKVKDYIPPCTRVNSSEKLVNRYREYNQYLSLIRDSAIKIIEKIRYKRKTSQEQNRLADDIECLCSKFLDFFMDSYDHFRLTLSYSPPIQLFEFFARMARVLHHAMDMGYDKSHMLQYFHQYAINLSATQINELIVKTFESNYTHTDIHSSLEPADNLLGLLNELFEKLKSLDYRELAPRNIVTRDTFNEPPSRIGPKSSGGSIQIKRPGRSEHLGDELLE